MTEVEVKRITAQRAGHKSYATRLVNEAEGHIQRQSHHDVVRMRAISSLLTEKLETIDSFDNQILATITDEEQIEAAVVESSEYRMSIQQVLIAISNVLDKINIQQKDERDSVKSFGKPQNAKLPKLIIKPFSGDILKFQEFWESYNSAVHENEELDKVTKFNYLRSLLQSQASSVISGLSLTADNYDEAINLLYSRFGNKQVLISTHIDKLLSLPVVKSQSELPKLREIYDCIEINVRSLKSLDITSSHYGPILVSIVMSKLPNEIRLQISRLMATATSAISNDEWKIDELLKYLKQEIESRELCNYIASTSDEAKPRRQADNYTASSLVAGTQGEKYFGCVFCDQNHSHSRCDSVTEIGARREILRKKRRCFLCLKPHHTVKFCRSSYKCVKCKRKHHVSICGPQPPPQTDRKEQNDEAKSVALNVVGNEKSATFLQTAKAIVSGRNSEPSLCVRVLFDGCAQKSFVTENTCSRLHLDYCRKEHVIIKGFGRKDETMRLLDVVRLRVCNTSRSECRVIEAYVVPIICSPICDQSIKVAQVQHEHLRNLNLADSNDENTELEIDVLIGADNYWNFVSNKIISGTTGPVALYTSLGWVLSGKMISCESSSTNMMQITTMSTTAVEEKGSENNNNLETLVQNFWQLDAIGVVDSVSDTNDEDIFEKFKENIVFDGSRYTVNLPWKQGTDMLPDNFLLCKRRLKSLWERLKKNTELLLNYDDIIRTQILDGIVEVVDNVNLEVGNVHYIPHREVVREHKVTSKVRIVYDASAKLKYRPSLNECLEKGPCMLPKIFDILIRFRCFKYALTSDIKSAFLNIRVDQKDRDSLRFLWFDDVNNVDPRIVIMRFTSVMFGLTCSPFLLLATISVHMRKFGNIYPEFVERFLRDLFMDDSVSGAQDMQEAFQFYSISRQLMKDGGFQLRKWHTNDKALRELILKSENEVFGEIEDIDVSEVKVLGVDWDVDKDLLIFSVEPVIKDALCYEGIISKRYILRVIASIFDPLGVLSPLVAGFKMMLQDVCQLKSGWDTEVSQDLQIRWKKLLKTTSEMGSLRISRNYLEGKCLSDVRSMEMHGFSDSSAKIYAAVVYLRVIFNDGNIITKFIASKSRVTPIKKLSIPRLELMSCLILSRLIKIILESIVDYEIRNVFCWSDSRDALCWIKDTGKVWKRFVQNRVREIREILPVATWNHCPGALNPADIPSRGLSIANSERQKLWLEGPTFLICTDKFWPNSVNYSESPETRSCLIEIKANVNSTAVEVNNNGIQAIIDINSYHSYNRLIQVTCYVKRFIENCKSAIRGNGNGLLRDAITIEEKAIAKRMWIMNEQKTINDKTLNQLKVSLGAYIDEVGVIRLKGRLERSELNYNTKYPIFIPRDSHIGDLIISDAHQRLLHSGMKDTLCEIRTEFWLSRGRERVRKLLNKCVLCRKYEAKPLEQLPASPLPDFRVQCCDPFTNTGIDYLGPLYVYPTPSGKNMDKVHVVLYTCANTRAVHLDIVPDATSVALVNSLRRFISRRGIPKLFISDNATCFKGPELVKFLNKFDIVWKFIMEVSPWWGGFWERMVQTVKRSLRKILRRTSTTYEELLTVITEIEGVINCRPLCYVYSDDIEEVLTPSHLLTGRRLISYSEVPDQIYEENEQTMKKRLDYLRTLVENYKNRWLHEYLTELREYQRSNNKSPAKEAKVGDIVLIQDDLPRTRWRMGKIETLIKSKDGYVRACKLRVFTKTKKIAYLNRPVNKLCYFEVSSVAEAN